MTTNYINIDTNERLTDTVIGHCGVDSGSLMVVDPCYVMEDDRSGEATSKYLNATMPTCDPPGYNEAEGGVVVRTMYGDGTYPLHAMIDSKGRIHAIYLLLGDEPEDDEDWFQGREDAIEDDEDDFS